MFWPGYKLPKVKRFLKEFIELMMFQLNLYFWFVCFLKSNNDLLTFHFFNNGKSESFDYIQNYG